MRRWPPRLPDQPIFYPVLNRDYAMQIARDWNAPSPTHAGYVTRFRLSDSFASQFPRQVVGGQQHEELWVPAEQLHELNVHIIGHIEVLGAFFSPGFYPFAASELQKLALALALGEPHFSAALQSSQSAVFLSYHCWSDPTFSRSVQVPDFGGLLDHIDRAWQLLHPEILLQR